MYPVAHCLLIIGHVAIWIAIGEMILLAWPVSLIFVLVALGRVGLRKGELLTLGSARMARRDELASAGMLNVDRGLILGRLESTGE